MHGKVCSERKVDPDRVTLLEDEQYWETDLAMEETKDVDHAINAPLFSITRRNPGDLMYTILKVSFSVFLELL